MKRIVAGGATALVLTSLLIAAALRSRGTAADSPAQCLDQMYVAMKTGDVPAYLSCFTGELRERLARDAAEQTTAGFSTYIRELVAPVKGRAVEDKSDRADPDHAQLVVDRVYADRPWERQAYRLRRVADSWRIYQIEAAELHEPPVPYGTPAVPVPENSERADGSDSAK